MPSRPHHRLLEVKKNLHHHSIVGPSDKMVSCVLLAICKHCWIYFATPLKLYISKGIEHRLIMYKQSI